MSLRANPPTADSGPSPAAPERRSGGRLGFLDALRGVAVGFVLVQHVLELVWPAFAEFTTNYVQLGQLGVVVFFLCSGFIIPATLEKDLKKSTGHASAGSNRTHALGMFWVSRFFRLYPLYWLSLGLAAVLAVASRYAPPEPMSTGDWLVDITMLQTYLGSPDAIGLYWSLAYEMAFYISVSVLFVFGLHRRSVGLALTASAGCMVLALLWEPLLDRPISLGFFHLATMFTGTVFYRWYAGTVRLRTLGLCVGVALVAGFCVVFSALFGRDRPDQGGAASFVPMLAAWLGAYLIFSVGVWLWRGQAPRWLRWIGMISYSVYLMQALVIALVPIQANPVLTVALWVAGTIAVSVVTYHLVEKPAVRLGRRVSIRVS